MDIGSLSATTGVSQTQNESQIQSSHTDDDLTSFQDLQFPRTLMPGNVSTLCAPHASPVTRTNNFGGQKKTSSRISETVDLEK